MRCRFLIMLIIFACNLYGQTTRNQYSNGKSINYLFENDTVIQTAKIIFKNNTTILFTLTNFNKIKKTKYNFSDTAMSYFVKGMDNGKVIFDEKEGEMYGILDYICNKSIH